MLYDNRLKWLYGFGAAFIALNMVLIVNGFYWLLALPLAMVIFMLYFFSLDKLVLLLVLLTPFTFKYRNEAMGFTVDIPTEPVIVAVMLLFFLRMLYEGHYDKRLLKHPITLLVVVQLIWMLLTSISSEMPLVSFKFFFSRLWFVTTFFFIGMMLFREYRNLKRFMWAFGVSLSLIVLYITFEHSAFGFERMVGTWIVRPFFTDHTNYSAVLAMVAPFFFLMTFNRTDKLRSRRMALLLFVIFLMGILFSFSRAAWLSLMIAAAAFVVLSLKIPLRYIVASLLLLAGSVYLFQNEIIMQMQRNTQESSGEFSEHVRSISNITSDASNLERINRWRSAAAMYQERPLLGWGPGTYQFVYAPFQRWEDHTVITTNFGDLGNAHSEYIGPLAESGLPGMLIMIALAVAVLATGVRLYKKLPSTGMRLMAMGITLGFITYFVHGLVNNFLDTDKASVPFWGMMAMLVALDVYHSKLKIEQTPAEQ